MSTEQEEDDDWVIEGRVRLDTADYLQAWFYVPEFRTIWMYLLFLPFGFALMVVGSPLPWRSWLSDAPWMLGAVPIGAVAAWVYRQHWAAASFARIGPQQISYRFDAEGLQVSSSRDRRSLKWAALSGSTETRHAFLVFLTGSQFFLMPKRAFSADDLPELAQLLGAIPKRATRGRALRTFGIWLLGCAFFLLLFEFLSSR